MAIKTTDPDKAAEILPAWFTWRMMSDQWSFGLMMSTGRMLAIERITSVSQDDADALWLDVELVQDVKRFGPYVWAGFHIDGAPTSRTEASVAVAHVVYAVELADT